jgi:hypothetical protein
LVEYAILIGAIGITLAIALYFAAPGIDTAVQDFALDVEDCIRMDDVACPVIGG